MTLYIISVQDRSLTHVSFPKIFQKNKVRSNKHSATNTQVYILNFFTGKAKFHDRL